MQELHGKPSATERMAGTPPLPVSSGRRGEATERILKAAATRLAISGASVLTMQEVAEEAGVSKALIHYHFHDKDTLLARLVVWITEGLVRRERASLASSTPGSAIDDLWRWLEGELARGHVRALVELAGWRGGKVRAGTVGGRSTRDIRRRLGRCTRAGQPSKGASVVRRTLARASRTR